MSFFLIKELSVIYLFLFYSYIYFTIDEEFVVFIIISLWVLFVIVFYIKTISSIFYDSMEELSSEFFFFHDKKNMILAIFKDQYQDFINLNKFLYNFFSIFQNTINISINNKAIFLYNSTNLYLNESLNFFKSFLKTSLVCSYISIFAFFNNLLVFLINELNIIKSNFYNVYFNVKLSVSGDNLNNNNLLTNSYSEASLENLKHYLIYNNDQIFDLNEFIIYKNIIRTSTDLTSNDIILLNSINDFKSPSVLRVLKKLNKKSYFNNVFLYFLLNDFSFFLKVNK